MKVVVLAGGFGTRISEESAVRPKPMVEIGGKPILWHIMKIYASYGFDDFVISAGYKGYVIKEYFSNYFLHTTDVTFDLKENRTSFHTSSAEPWTVTIADTGEATMTGGRIKRVADFLDGETFFMTYGDCLADIDMAGLLDFHRAHGALATVTAVQPAGRFGALHLDDAEGRVTSFHEKPRGDGGWINGGFFVLEPGVLDYVESDSTVWESEPMQHLARDGQLMAYNHTGYWQNLDTLRDRMVLEDQWASGKPLWKRW